MKMLQRNKPNRKSVVESMMDTLEEYVTQLEDKVGINETFTVTTNLKQQQKDYYINNTQFRLQGVRLERTSTCNEHISLLQNQKEQVSPILKGSVTINSHLENSIFLSRALHFVTQCT